MREVEKDYVLTDEEKFGDLVVRLKTSLMIHEGALDELKLRRRVGDENLDEDDLIYLDKLEARTSMKCAVMSELLGFMLMDTISDRKAYIEGMLEEDKGIDKKVEEKYSEIPNRYEKIRITDLDTPTTFGFKEMAGPFLQYSGADAFAKVPPGFTSDCDCPACQLARGLFGHMGDPKRRH